MSIYEMLIKNERCLQLARDIRNNIKNYKKKKRIKGKYKFINRKKDTDKMCYILAGYKSYLYEDVFGRIKKYIPKNIDVCIISCGLWSDELDNIAKKNNWSYLSVEKNKVTLAQNIAITLFDKAKMFYKLDEDIFITKNFFSQLEKTYKDAEKNSSYRVGFVTPLIPLNGYSHIRVLDKLNLINQYENKFGRAQHNWDPSYKVASNPDVAKFMWGENNEKLKNIDKIDEDFSKEKLRYSICPIRFSIGAIMFSRQFWEDIGRFKVGIGNNLGVDEIQMCNHLLADSRVIVVSENTVVGHFSYGKQTEKMKKYYEENREIFKVR